MKQFELVLINEKQKSYKLISMLLLIINFISILLLAYYGGFIKWWLLILSLTAGFMILTGYYLKNENDWIFLSLAFFFMSLAWFSSGYWPAGILNLGFALLNALALSKTIIRVTDKNIFFSSLFSRTVAWNELNNAMLKDDLLTIDFKNNRLIQQLVDKNYPIVDEKEFNNFCREQLNK